MGGNTGCGRAWWKRLGRDPVSFALLCTAFVLFLFSAIFSVLSLVVA